MSSDIYKNLAGLYDSDETNQKFYRYWSNQLLSFLGKDANGKNIVELGCGSGISTERIRQAFPTANYWGIDASEEMLSIAREKASLADVRLLCSSAENIPLENESADLILSTFAFHWFDTGLALKEIQRLLKPGAHASLLIPTTAGVKANSNGNRWLQRTFIRQHRKSPIARRASIGMRVDDFLVDLENTVLNIKDSKICEWTEHFSSESSMWQYLRTRGSLQAIFEKVPDMRPSTTPEELHFSWRVLLVKLVKDG